MTLDSPQASNISHGQTSDIGNGNAKVHKHKMGYRNGKDKEHDRLLKEINLIDKW